MWSPARRAGLSDWCFWSCCRDSNPRPLPYQGSALPLSYSSNAPPRHSSRRKHSRDACSSHDPRGSHQRARGSARRPGAADGPQERRSPESLERVMGIEPTRSAWKADVLPLNYTRLVHPRAHPGVEACPRVIGRIGGRAVAEHLAALAALCGAPFSGRGWKLASETAAPPATEALRHRVGMVGRTGFEPVKALPSDLQSDPFGRSGISPTGTWIALARGAVRSRSATQASLTRSR